MYNAAFHGPSYSVKYLGNYPQSFELSIEKYFSKTIGIVDGTMGILSRKMAMPATMPLNPAHIKEVMSKKDVKK